METNELLDRFELLYPTNSKLSDLRRAYIDQDLSSLFRLLPQEVNGSLDDLRKAVLENNIHSIFRLSTDEDLRKLILEDNVWKLWPILERYADTHFISAFKCFFNNNITIDKDCFSRGQLQSKLWLVSELEKLNLDLGTIFLCAGWYATLATMIFESKIKVDKIRSFDIDHTCIEIAKIFNKPWLMDKWKFQASVLNIHDINYNKISYKVHRNDGTETSLYDVPDTIINTSCEHIENFNQWYNKIPEGKLVVLQSNNFFEVKEHVNCSSDIDSFNNSTPMKRSLFLGELVLEKYTRFMKIGYK